MIGTGSEYGMPEMQPSPFLTKLEPLSDGEIARGIVEAVRQTPGVLDMSPGLYALAATYGPGESIVGVVLLHTTLTTYALAVHVIADYAASMAASYPTPSEGEDGAEDEDKSAVLVRLADLIRRNVYQTARSSGMSAPVAIDVYIDDIQ